jgi:hypothetical protein
MQNRDAARNGAIRMARQHAVADAKKRRALSRNAVGKASAQLRAEQSRRKILAQADRSRSHAALASISRKVKVEQAKAKARSAAARSKLASRRASARARARQRQRLAR